MAILCRAMMGNPASHVTVLIVVVDSSIGNGLMPRCLQFKVGRHDLSMMLYLVLQIRVVRDKQLLYLDSCLGG